MQDVSVESQTFPFYQESPHLKVQPQFMSFKWSSLSFMISKFNILYRIQGQLKGWNAIKVTFKDIVFFGLNILNILNMWHRACEWKWLCSSVLKEHEVWKRKKNTRTRNSRIPSFVLGGCVIVVMDTEVTWGDQQNTAILKRVIIEPDGQSLKA